MAEFLEKMELTLYFMRLEDKYWGVFLLGVFVLIYLGRKETKGLLWMTLATAGLCLCPPLAYGLCRLFPALESYYPLWHIVPAGVVVCATFTILQQEWCESKWCTVLFLAGSFVILFFAGDFSYTSKNVWNDDITFLGKEESKTYELVLSDMEEQGKNVATLWGPDKLMADSRIYSACLHPIYGKDVGSEGALYSESLVSMHQGYSSFESTDKPVENMEDQIMAIANCLNVFPDVSCDYVVMIKPEKKVEEWIKSTEEETADEVTTDDSEETVKETETIDPELIERVLDIDTICIFEELGYVYVGETESLQIFRRL